MRLAVLPIDLHKRIVYLNGNHVNGREQPNGDEPMTTAISRDELRHRLAARPPLVLIETLPARYYEQAHLPGALNIPHDAVDTLAPRLVSNKNAEIVVYCASATCKNSGIAAQRLTELGYRNVRTYDEGKADWIAAGLDVESGPDRDNAPPDGRPTTRTGDDVS
jgi:rhodanese-related sulfurtransferase